VHNEHCSDWFGATAGVPQGTVLAPLLFIIYINDIFDDELQADLSLFADDLAILPRMAPSGTQDAAVATAASSAGSCSRLE